MAAFTATILSNHTLVDPREVLTAIDVVQEYNRLPWARLVYLDGDSASNKFALSQSGVFSPGRSVEIKLRYEGQSDTTIFTGVVLRQRVSAGLGGSCLTVELKDSLHETTVVRKNRVFENQTDTEILHSILGMGRAGSIAETVVTHPVMVQCAATDWDFILSRADLNGLLVRVWDGKLDAQAPAHSAVAERTLSYGSGLVLELELESDASSYLSSASGAAWDLAGQAVLSADGSAPEAGSQGAALAEALPDAAQSASSLQSITPLPQAEVSAWASAQLSKNRLSTLRGRIQVHGDATLALGSHVAIEGVASLYDGAALVTGVRHRVTESGWITDVQFGLPERWFAQREHFSAPPAGGMLPAMGGLQIGVVQAWEEDPQGQFRVPVSVPALRDSAQPSGGLLWARLAMFDAGPARGAWFLPQEGDEVVLGFFNDDPRQPVILGSLYSSGRPPPSGQSVQLRGFASPGGQLLVMDDSSNSIALKTKSGQSIQLDDDGGITVTGTGDISLQAGDSGTFSVRAKTIDIKGDNFQT